MPAPAPLDAPSDTLSVVNAQLVGGLLAEGPRDPPPPQGKRSWNKRVAITADRFGQEVVQKIADLKAAMDQAINSQSEAARNRAIWLDEESELLLFLRDHEISYIQIAEVRDSIQRTLFKIKSHRHFLRTILGWSLSPPGLLRTRKRALG